MKEGRPVDGVHDLRERRARGVQDLRNANLRNADLRRENFAQVNFSNACLANSNLARTYLSMVNFDGAELAGSNLLEAYMPRSKLRGADLRRVILEGVQLREGDLARANLRRAKAERSRLYMANLEGADLSHANFERADLSSANLERAKMIGTRFVTTNLSKANLAWSTLKGASLAGADLSGANLADADLDGADLTGTTFSLTHFARAHLHRVQVGGTRFLSVDLSRFCLGAVVHLAPSDVDFRTVTMSVHAPGLRDFLCAAGMPFLFADYMIDCARSLREDEVFSLLRSTFISYGGPDEVFAKRLNDALALRGVKTFFFKNDAVPGEKLHRMMRTGVNLHDRIIVICSHASLARPGLQNEIDETLAREAREGGQVYLIPIRLDNGVFSDWCPDRPDLAQAIRDRVIADFSEHEIPSAFGAALDRLMQALKQPVTIT